MGDLTRLLTFRNMADELDVEAMLEAPYRKTVRLSLTRLFSYVLCPPLNKWRRIYAPNAFGTIVY